MVNITVNNVEAINEIYELAFTNEQLENIKNHANKQTIQAFNYDLNYVIRSDKCLMGVKLATPHFKASDSTIFILPLSSCRNNTKEKINKFLNLILDTKKGRYILSSKKFYNFQDNTNFTKDTINNKFYSKETAVLSLDSFDLNESEVSDQIIAQKLFGTFLKNGTRYSYHNNDDTYLNLPILKLKNINETTEHFKFFFLFNKDYFFKNHTAVDNDTIDVLEQIFKKDYLSTKVNKEKTSFGKMIKGSIINNNSYQNVPPFSCITHVWEKNNIRYFLTSCYEGYYHFSKDIKSTDYITNNKFHMIDSDDPLYDFVDIGRIIYNDETSHYNKKGKIIFTDLDPIPISRNILNASVTLQDEILFWDNNDIKMAVNREMRKEERIKSEKDSFINLTKKINIKLNNLNSNESIKFNEMVITNNSIEYQKQKITADIANLSSILIKEAARLVAIDNINFDALSELFFLKISQSQIPVSGIIGNVSFCLNPTTSTNTAGTSVTRYNINNKRINKNEIEECLRRALCYQTQLDYDYFIDSVNKCSLKVHNLLQLGIDITVYDDFDNITYNVKFPIDRKNRKNYIVINNEEYQIKNTNKFLTLQNTSKRIPLLVLVEKLLDNKIVKDVTINNIKNIIKQGRRTYEEAIEKSNQLLEETLKLFNLKEETKHIANATRTGYLIKGKLREYFLEVQNDDSHTGNCGVYDTKSEKYICIVDKSTSQVGMDKIVNRIYALHNDNLLASKITTL